MQAHFRNEYIDSFGLTSGQALHFALQSLVNGNGARRFVQDDRRMGYGF